MPTPAEHLDLAYPGLAEAAGEAATAWALAVAEDYRPACLSLIRQDLAQAYYAAHLLMSRQTSAGAGSTAQRPSVILEEKEGDNSIKYADPNAAGVSLQATAYDQWKRLSDICRYGAIITRFGL